MHVPAEQTSEDDVIIRQQQKDRREALRDDRPTSFRDYLRVNGIPGAAPARKNRNSREESLCDVAEKARRAPRVG